VKKADLERKLDFVVTFAQNKQLGMSESRTAVEPFKIATRLQPHGDPVELEKVEAKGLRYMPYQRYCVSMLPFQASRG
jgi:hypothetical protein